MYDREQEQKQFEAIIEAIGSRHTGAILAEERALGDLALTIDRRAIHAVLALLREKGFNLLLDIDAVDNLKRGGEERFEVVYILYSIGENTRLRLKVMVPESEPELPTATDLWQAANWGEREVWDMMGISFAGHPNLVRILTHHQFEGHALRKDYPIMKEQWCTSTRDLREDLERE